MISVVEEVNIREREAWASMGRKLREYRKALALSSKDVASQIGMSDGYLRTIEDNLIKNRPHKEFLSKLAQFFKIDENDLYRVYGYTEVQRSSPEIARTPQSILVDLNQMANSFIPVYNSFGSDSKPVDYVSLGWQSYVHNNLKGFIGCKYENIKETDLVIVNTKLGNNSNDLYLYAQGDKMVLHQGSLAGANLIGKVVETIIRL
jgi:transcriptional regulator with XRE-family HTH domain